MYARVLAEDVEVDGTVVAAAGADLGDVLIDELVARGRVRGSGPVGADL